MFGATPYLEGLRAHLYAPKLRGESAPRAIGKTP